MCNIRFSFFQESCDQVLLIIRAYYYIVYKNYHDNIVVVYPHSLFTSDNIATLIIGNNTNNILLLSLRSDFHDRNQKSTEIDTPPLIGTGDKRHFPYAENFEFLKIHRERWPNPIGAKAALGHELERLEFAWMHLDSVRRQAIR